MSRQDPALGRAREADTQAAPPPADATPAPVPEPAPRFPSRWRLTFEPERERAYRATTHERALPAARPFILLGVLFYAAFGVLDAFVAPQTYRRIWVLRGLVFCVPSLLSVLLSYRRGFARFYQLWVGTIFLLAGLGIVAMLAMVPPQAAHSYYAGLILVLLYSYTLFRTRPRWGALVGTLIVIAYELVAVLVLETPRLVLLSNNFFFLSAHVIGLLACYINDRLARLAWHSNRRIAEQMGRIEQMNSELADANGQLKELATHDGLTGLANRRLFDAHLRAEWERLARDRRPLAVVLCDLDRFKLYNDAFGHLQGDSCLRKVARVLKAAARRPGDLAARQGGEEFGLILPNTDGEGALHVAQCLRAEMAELGLPHAAGAPRAYVTLSLGVAAVVPKPGGSMEDLLRGADNALYEAKELGRDRVVAGEARRPSVPPSATPLPQMDLPVDLRPPGGAVTPPEGRPAP